MAKNEKSTKTTSTAAVDTVETQAEETVLETTAENLAAHMVNVVGPMLLDEHGVELVSCTIEETSKCHVEYTK
jgi:hypothetical protein